MDQSRRYTCRVSIGYDASCLYIYCSRQQIPYRDGLYQQLNTKDPEFIEGVDLKRGVCSAAQSIAVWIFFGRQGS